MLRGTIVLAASEVLAPRPLSVEPVHLWFEDLPAWGSLYGLAACVAIIVVSKLLGHLWLSVRKTTMTVEWVHPGLLLIAGAWILPFLGAGPSVPSWCSCRSWR